MKRKKLGVFLTLMLVVSMVLPTALADAAPITTRSTAVDGRILRTSQSGDTAEWVEIARNGDYSLIVRRDVLPNSQIIFSNNNANNNNYLVSKARDMVNTWFKNTLNSGARMRRYSMKSSAVQQLGFYADLNSGHSQPTTTYTKTGDDVAFLLSFSEAALFCSTMYATSTTTLNTSSAIARSNFNKLNIIVQTPAFQHNTWYLRSPAANSSSYAQISSVGGHNNYIPEGSAWCSSVQAGYPYVRPALWVDSMIFEADPGTINIRHLDAATMSEIAATQTFTVPAGNYGPYGPQNIANYNAGILAPGSAPVSGTIGSNQTITITFLYTKAQGIITLKHIDADTRTDIVSPEVVTVAPGAYGPYNARTFTGYQAGTLAAGSAPASGVISSNQSITITYEYRKIPTTATIILKHIDADTRVDIVTPDTLTVPAGSYGPYNARSFTGYQAGTLAVGSAPASGTISVGQSITITYEYRKTPITATIILKHIDASTRLDIVAPETVTVNAGSYGPYYARSFPGYQAGTLAAGSAPANGTISAGQTLTITYEYTQSVAMVIVWHKDAITSANVAPYEFYVLPVGPYGPYGPVTLAGYTSALAPGSAPASGTLTANQIVEITYLYSRAEATITVEHLDADTRVSVSPTQTYTVNAGTYGPYNPVSVPGYSTGVLASGSAPASGTIAAGQNITITYLYSRGTAFLVVRHVDAATQIDIVPMDFQVVPAGAYGPVLPITIPNYQAGTLAPGSDPISGTIAINQVVIVIYQYSRAQSTINVEHRDAITGVPVAATQNYSVNPGAYGPYLPVTVPNYQTGTLAPGSAPASGTIASGETLTIIYQYQRAQASIRVIYRNLSDNSIISDTTSSVQAGAYGPILPAVLPGFSAGILMSESDPIQGTINAGQTITIVYGYAPDTATIIVEHREYGSYRLLRANSVFTVSPGAYGPYEPVIIIGHWGGTWDPTSAPVSGTISGGETITIRFLYRVREEI